MNLQETTTSRIADTVRTVCPVCGPHSVSDVGVCHGHRVVRCDRCSLMFVGECRPVQETEEFFRREHVGDEETTELHYVCWRKDSLQREARIIRQLRPEGGRLLDVGTASGLFLREFDGQAEWRVEGVEPSEVSVRYAKSKFGLNVRQGYLTEQDYPENCFDVVTSLDAFNCHRTPNEDLAEICRILKPGGIFAVEIPGQSYRMLTGSGPLCRLLFGVSLRLNAGVNFFFYTTEALVTMAERAGLTFCKAWPEAMPTRGSLLARVLKQTYFQTTAAIYHVTSGRVHFAPKEFLIFRKPTADGPAVDGSTTAN